MHFNEKPLIKGEKSGYLHSIVAQVPKFSFRLVVCII